ncbi:hypothetical protein ACTTAF_13565 [Rhodobacter capsulatus]|uniref:hypothetical protein n=1 Tax=Rhodobacter capsulatus TaxID=1061 RepID=UPI0003D365EE|nr:hypothetical protein [Rhodobacter capsulatus]ETD86379.1 hypothetical protein U703_00340 [Rhodobacter capsulatus YW1]
MARLVTVRFLRGSAPYNTGEIAGFEAQVARALIASGAAEAVKAAPSLPATAAGREACKRVVLTFLAAAPPYHAGDVAGFEPLEAAALVARGKAVPLTTRTAAGEEPADEEEPAADPAEDPGAEEDRAGAEGPDDGIDDDAPEPEFVLVDHDDDGAGEDLDEDGEDGAPPVQGRAG